MKNQGYPKLNLYTKKQLANVIRGKDLSFDSALKLIDDCLINKDKYWSDNPRESKPDEDKWVRSASGTPLGKLQKRINQKVLAPHDSELPIFIYGGVGKKGIKNAVIALQGKKNKRTLLKVDMRRFFEHISYEDIVNTLVCHCNCEKDVAQIIAEIACVHDGKKSSGNTNEKVLARGFSTSSRLAIWCNLNLFRNLFYCMTKRLKGHDPKIVVYMDDIGITASRVDSTLLASLYEDITKIIENASKLEVNKNKTKIIDYLQREYDVIDGHLLEGRIAQFEFLGIGIGRNRLYPGVKIRSKMAKLLKKPNLSDKELQTLKGQKRYANYITSKKLELRSDSPPLSRNRRRNKTPSIQEDKTWQANVGY